MRSRIRSSPSPLFSRSIGSHRRADSLAQNWPSLVVTLMNALWSFPYLTGTNQARDYEGYEGVAHSRRSPEVTLSLPSAPVQGLFTSALDMTFKLHWPYPNPIFTARTTFLALSVTSTRSLRVRKAQGKVRSKVRRCSALSAGLSSHDVRSQEESPRNQTYSSGITLC